MSASDNNTGDYESLRRLVWRVWQRKYWLCASVLACTSILAAKAFLTAPVYRATAVLVPSGSERLMGGGLGGSGSLGGLAQLAGLSLGSMGSTTEESLAVLQSRQLTEKFLAQEALLPLLFAASWSEEAKAWKGPEKDHPTLAIAYKKFDRSVRSISHDRRTGLIRLSIEWEDPDTAAEWANKLVDLVNAEMRSRAKAESDASVSHLERELSLTSTVETREAISRLLESQINRRMISTVTDDYAFRVVEPAMAPDRRDFVRPRRMVMLVLGPMVGLALGLVFILLFDVAGQGAALRSAKRDDVRDDAGAA